MKATVLRTFVLIVDVACASSILEAAGQRALTPALEATGGSIGQASGNAKCQVVLAESDCENDI